MLKWQAFCSAMCASGHLRNEPTRLCTPTDATDTHKVVAPGSTDKQTPTAAHATAVEARINSTDEPADLYASMLACAPLRPACVKVHLPVPPWHLRRFRALRGPLTSDMPFCTRL